MKRITQLRRVFLTQFGFTRKARGKHRKGGRILLIYIHNVARIIFSCWIVLMKLYRQPENRFGFLTITRLLMKVITRLLPAKQQPGDEILHANKLVWKLIKIIFMQSIKLLYNMIITTQYAGAWSMEKNKGEHDEITRKHTG